MRYFCVAPYLLAFFRPVFFFWDTQLDDCMNAEFEWLQMSACPESNLGSNSEVRNGWRFYRMYETTLYIHTV